MPWAKIDDLMPEHTKVLPLSDLAFRLHITAICHAARNLTDGHISHAALPGLGATNKSIGELRRAKLWEQEKGKGWLIHDYLDYNPSRAEVLAQRQQKAKAGRAGGQATATAAAQARAQAPATPSGKAPVPVPVPVLPDPSDQGPPAPSLKALKADFFGADAVPKQVGALVDIATLNGIIFFSQHKGRLGALLKKHGHGQHVYDVFMASLDKELPIDYLTKTLGGQHGQAGRQDSRSRQVTAADLDAAEPIAARAKQLREENAARRTAEKGGADV